MKSNSEKLTFKKVWKLFQETDKKFQETDKRIYELFKETDKRFKETDKKLRQLETMFVGQWGKLVESLVEGNLAKLLQERCIDVKGTRQRVKSWYNHKEIEVDILAINGKEVVAVEVKTTLRIEDVNEFIEVLKVFKKAFPEYRDKVVYGAVAFLTANEEADKYAYCKGPFRYKSDRRKCQNFE